MKKYIYIWVVLLLSVSLLQVQGAPLIADDGKVTAQQSVGDTLKRQTHSAGYERRKTVERLADKVGEKNVIAVEYYNVVGVRLSKPSKGLNIVKKMMSDGSTVTTKVLL